MRPANDPSIDYKALVREGYNRCALAYEEARRDDLTRDLHMLTTRIPEGSAVLDVGSGSGVPVARILAEHFSVTGIDISDIMVERARHNVPAATFLRADVMSADYDPRSFDAIVALYVIFHLPRPEQSPLLFQIHRWLRPGGYLLATFATDEEPPYLEDDFFGVTMYWSNASLAEYEMMLDSIGFELVERAVIGHGYGVSWTGKEERHPLVLARKR